MIALATCLLAVIIVTLALPEIRLMSTSLRYDNQPPITYHRFEWQSDQVQRGGRLEYQATYSKRIDCHPPAGRGWITYKFRQLNQAGQPTGLTHTVNAVRDADWPAGSNMPGSSFAPVPIDLARGRYQVWGEANFECSGASKMLRISTPKHIVQVN